MGHIHFQLSTLIFLWNYFLCVDSNALLRPSSRGLIWTRSHKSASSYNYMDINCGGISSIRRNSGKCGLCGDAYDRRRNHETGGKYHTGVTAQVYRQGQKGMDVKILLNTASGGHFEFKLCDPKGGKETAACFEENPLVISEGVLQGDPYKYVPERPGILQLRLEIPPWFSCHQCVLQWRYITSNTWGRNEQGRGCLGCGPQEQYVNCADVTIEGWEGPPTISPPITTAPLFTSTTAIMTFPSTTSSPTTTTTTATTTTRKPNRIVRPLIKPARRQDGDEGSRLVFHTEPVAIKPWMPINYEVLPAHTPEALKPNKPVKIDPITTAPVTQKVEYNHQSPKLEQPSISDPNNVFGPNKIPPPPTLSPAQLQALLGTTEGQVQSFNAITEAPPILSPYLSLNYDQSPTFNQNLDVRNANTISSSNDKNVHQNPLSRNERTFASVGTTFDINHEFGAQQEPTRYSGFELNSANNRRQYDNLLPGSLDNRNRNAQVALSDTKKSNIQILNGHIKTELSRMEKTKQGPLDPIPIYVDHFVDNGILGRERFSTFNLSPVSDPGHPESRPSPRTFSSGDRYPGLKPHHQSSNRFASEPIAATTDRKYERYELRPQQHGNDGIGPNDNSVTRNKKINFVNPTDYSFEAHAGQIEVLRYGKDVSTTVETPTETRMKNQYSRYNLSPMGLPIRDIVSDAVSKKVKATSTMLSQDSTNVKYDLYPSVQVKSEPHNFKRQETNKNVSPETKPLLEHEIQFEVFNSPTVRTDVEHSIQQIQGKVIQVPDVFNAPVKTLESTTQANRIWFSTRPSKSEIQPIKGVDFLKSQTLSEPHVNDTAFVQSGSSEKSEPTIRPPMSLPNKEILQKFIDFVKAKALAHEHSTTSVSPKRNMIVSETKSAIGSKQIVRQTESSVIMKSETVQTFPVASDIHQHEVQSTTNNPHVAIISQQQKQIQDLIEKQKKLQEVLLRIKQIQEQRLQRESKMSLEQRDNTVKHPRENLFNKQTIAPLMNERNHLDSLHGIHNMNGPRQVNLDVQPLNEEKWNFVPKKSSTVFTTKTSTTTPSTTTTTTTTPSPLTSTLRTAARKVGLQRRQIALKTTINRFVDRLTQKMSEKIRNGNNSGMFPNIEIVPLPKEAVMTILRSIAKGALRRNLKNNQSTPANHHETVFSKAADVPIASEVHVHEPIKKKSISQNNINTNVKEDMHKIQKDNINDKRFSMKQQNGVDRHGHLADSLHGHVNAHMHLNNGHSSADHSLAKSGLVPQNQFLNHRPVTNGKDSHMSSNRNEKLPHINHGDVRNNINSMLSGSSSAIHHQKQESTIDNGQPLITLVSQPLQNHVKHNENTLHTETKPKFIENKDAHSALQSIHGPEQRKLVHESKGDNSRLITHTTKNPFSSDLGQEVLRRMRKLLADRRSAGKANNNSSNSSVLVMPVDKNIVLKLMRDFKAIQASGR